MNLHTAGTDGTEAIRYQGVGITYRVAYKFIEFRANAGFIRTVTYRPNSQYYSYEHKLDANPYYNIWLGVIFSNGFRVGVHSFWVPETIETVEIYTRQGVWEQSEIIIGKRKPFNHPSIGFTVPLFRGKRK